MGEAIHSMGLSAKNDLYWGPMFVIDHPGDENKFGGQVYAGFTRYLVSPLFGLGLGVEGYVEALEDEDLDGGGRLLGVIRPFFIQAGVDYAIDQESTDFILSLAFPLRRGGVFGRGSEFRFDSFIL